MTISILRICVFSKLLVYIVKIAEQIRKPQFLLGYFKISHSGMYFLYIETSFKKNIILKGVNTLQIGQVFIYFRQMKCLKTLISR